MKKKQAAELLQTYIDGNCTEQEKALVESWYLRYGSNKRSGLSLEEGSDDLNEVRALLLKEIDQKPRKLHRMLKVVGAAAAILTICTIGVLFFSVSKEESRSSASVPAQDVSPGGKYATLTLADGSQIVLDSIDNGEVVHRNGVRFTKAADGQLICETVNVGEERLKDVIGTFNTIETPVGGQYQVILPDGTKVWLNAASSIRYPVVFNGKEREVELTGEGYFEVAKNKTRPFKLKVNDTYVEVLGTHFNVMAYKGEQSINTTLLEGKVRVSKGSQHQTISPGQQTRIRETGRIEIVKDIDAEEVIAWKNGTFNFNNTDLRTVMRQLERWYDVEVDEDAMPERKFNGIVSRNVPLSKVLKMIEVTSGLKFTIEQIEGTQAERRVTMAE